ncbi:hypothetical protein SGLAU_26075 [Streptomyces glaucescens]|uniref:Uncharacterized protein n=1 Tax=Streptomyces glaucescens TaxID=1907 RepID=A0A089XAZ5_STRGA|nr:hypothetical protein SGLAU_26075 [Streptomyces glaucescens]
MGASRMPNTPGKKTGRAVPYRRARKKAGRPVPIRTVRPARSGRRSDVGQNVSFQLLSRPVSCAATSRTRSFQVPLATSPEAFTV